MILLLLVVLFFCGWSSNSLSPRPSRQARSTRTTRAARPMTSRYPSLSSSGAFLLSAAPISLFRARGRQTQKVLASCLVSVLSKISKRERCVFPLLSVINIKNAETKAKRDGNIHTDVTAPMPGGSTAKPPSETGV